MENKELFVKRVNDALVECGDGRYDRLESEPMRYEREGYEETVSDGCGCVSVAMDSLPAMLADMARLFI